MCIFRCRYFVVASSFGHILSVKTLPLIFILVQSCWFWILSGFVILKLYNLIVFGSSLPTPWVKNSSLTDLVFPLSLSTLKTCFLSCYPVMNKNVLSFLSVYVSFFSGCFYILFILIINYNYLSYFFFGSSLWFLD